MFDKVLIFSPPSELGSKCAAVLRQRECLAYVIKVLSLTQSPDRQLRGPHSPPPTARSSHGPRLTRWWPSDPWLLYRQKEDHRVCYLLPVAALLASAGDPTHRL